MTTALEGGEGSASRPGRSLPPGKTGYPLYGRLVGPQGRSEQVRKISPSTGCGPRTVQPVASHYTDWATRPTPTWITSDNSAFCPQIVVVRFVAQNEQQTYNINCALFINEMQSVYCEVRTGFISKTDYVLSLIGKKFRRIFRFYTLFVTLPHNKVGQA